MSTDLVIVPEWPPAKGYANGRIGFGAVLHVAGQVGWAADGKFVATDLVGQFARALDNVIAVVSAARFEPPPFGATTRGGVVTDIAEMTVYVTDMAAYRAARKQLGPIWRERMGAHFPAMALVAVTALVEREALVEIQAVAYLGHD